MLMNLTMVSAGEDEAAALDRGDVVAVGAAFPVLAEIRKYAAYCSKS
jgi:hypothetical protein